MEESMANQHKDGANQNQHTNRADKAMAATADAGANRPQPENIDSPENIGGERPNPSNTGSARQETGERLDLKQSEQPDMRDDR